MPAISLNAHQAIKIYGWRQPILVLDWNIVLEHRLTFGKLHKTLHIPCLELKKLQPLKAEWLKEKLFTSEDLPDLLPWKVHAFDDLNMSLAEVMCAGPPDANFFRETGVTFQHLRDKGLTVDLMKMFPFSVSDWRSLGMGRDFVDELSDVTCGQLFQMPKAVVAAAVQ